MNKIAGVLILFGMLCGSAALGAERSISLDDLGVLVSLSQPTIATGGDKVVVVVTRPDYEANRFEHQLLMVEVKTGKRQLLTTNRPTVQSPQFSPDGEDLAFIAADPNGKPQLFVLPLNGGEARMVTSAKEGVSFYAWHPEGKNFAYSAVASKDPKTKDNPTPDEKHNRSFEVGDNVYLASEASRPTHLWLISVQGGEARQLTSGDGGVTTLFGRGFEWSPDGNKLAVQLQPKPHSGEFLAGWIELIDVESASQNVLVDDLPVPVLAQFAPDGERVVFLRSTGPEPFFNPTGLFITGPKQEIRHLSHDIDRDLDQGVFLPDGQSLVVSAVDRTKGSLWQVWLDGKSRQIDLGPVHPGSILDVADSGTIAFVGSEANLPAELYVMASVDDPPRRLTDLNQEIAARSMGSVQTVSWDGPEGLDLNGVVVFPPAYRKGKRYPLVLNIHGGPMGASTEAFNFQAQLMAAQGWIVFSPNYRGSSSQGRVFQTAIINDAGDGPGRDVMSGIAMLKARGMVDEERIAVSGWSYGGYMTAWLTAHYQGWAAAVAGAAVTDWFDWYNLADMNVWSGLGLGGSPWRNDNAQNYWNQSPMKYAHLIRTPTLILSNTGDPRVTVSQSYKLYHALKDNAVPVQFVAYPIPGHFPQDPVHARDVYRRWINWIDRHFN